MKKRNLKLEDIVLLTEEVPNEGNPNAGLWYWSVITFDEFMKKFGDIDLAGVIQGLFFTRDYSNYDYKGEKIEEVDDCFLHDSSKFHCRFFSNISFAKDFVINEIPKRYKCEGEDKDYHTAEECKEYISSLLDIDLENFMLEADKERDEKYCYGRSIRNILLVNVLRKPVGYSCIMTEKDFFENFIKENEDDGIDDPKVINPIVLGLYQTKYKEDLWQTLGCCYKYPDGKIESFSVEARFCANKEELRIFTAFASDCYVEQEDSKSEEDKGVKSVEDEGSEFEEDDEEIEFEGDKELKFREDKSTDELRKMLLDAKTESLDCTYL